MGGDDTTMQPGPLASDSSLLALPHLEGDIKVWCQSESNQRKRPSKGHILRDLLQGTGFRPQEAGEGSPKPAGRLLGGQASGALEPELRPDHRQCSQLKACH